MPVTDKEAARQAIATFDTLSESQEEAKLKVDTLLASKDKFIDIHELFALYNVLYFRSMLLPRVELSWSPRLIVCAGICELVRNSDDGDKFTRIRLKLSEPLLKARARGDLVNTLLHECIHAYFYITTSWRRSWSDDGTEHGAGFVLLANAINAHGGYNITIFHEFHDEVDSYRTHVWQCDGPCKLQAPSFGVVKKAMNRPPNPGDDWWKKHEDECGGTFVKISEPELNKKQVEKLSGLKRAGLQKSKIDGWIKGGKLRDSSIPRFQPIGDAAVAGGAGSKRTRSPSGDLPEIPKKVKSEVSCPVCNVCVDMDEINEHLDEVHPA